MRKHKSFYVATGASILSALLLLKPIEALAECYCNLTEPVDVIVKNWQTFRPKVTAMHSLNAYLANSLGAAVYYVPTLDQLQGVRNRMYDCTDFRGTNQKFAAIYDGFFDVECQEVLKRRADGSYTAVPKMMQNTARGSERELTILGYDFLLTKEAVRDIVVNDTMVSATYHADTLDLKSGSIDLRTALMDIYKAVGQELVETTYVFANDPGMKLETSPIQNEIHLQLAQENSIDVSAGAGYVFATRTNPDLYWDRAMRDHVVVDSGNADGSVIGSTTTASRALTLSEFCAYAYEVMRIYGEPVMTSSEKGILLQMYGTSIPYKEVDGFAIEAIENFIAKGIISPDDDASKLNWNAPITPEYMLTLLMRIKDMDSRMTYKDVQITITPNLLDQHYYAANVRVDDSPIVNMQEDPLYAKVSTYVDNAFGKDKVMGDLGAHGVSPFYIQNHLVVEAANGKYLPLTTLVTSAPDSDGQNHLYSAASDKSVNTTPFGECLGWSSDQSTMTINVYVKPIVELLQGDSYHIHLQKEDGTYSSGYLKVTPGKSGSYSTPDRGTVDIDVDEDDKYWEEDGIDLATNSSTVVIIDILAGSETSIKFKPVSGGGERSLADIMSNVDADGYGYLVNGDATDLHFKKISDTRYQVEGIESKDKLQARVTNPSGVKNSIAGFVKRDKELIVSSEWLKSAGFISGDPVSSGDNVIILKSRYNEIYLDRSRKIVVAGTTVYNLSNLTEDEIFYKNGDHGYMVNFRAVLGWTGDFLIFKNSSNGEVTVSVKDYPKDSGKNSIGSEYGGQLIEFKNIQVDSTLTNSAKYNRAGLSMYVQGSNSSLLQDTKYGKYSILMTATYPFANWFVYSRGNLTQEDATDRDWLFVFKPTKVSLGNGVLKYDDTKSREIFRNVVGKFDMSEDLISVWAYPLDKNDQTNNPEGMSWNEEYGWVYTPTEVSDIDDFLRGYLDPGTTYQGGTSGKPQNVLPLIRIKLGDSYILQCVNFNSYSVNENMGETFLKYGTIPGVSINPFDTLEEILNAGRDFITKVASSVTGIDFKNGTITLKKPESTSNEVAIENCKSYPTVVSPALWVMNLQSYTFDDLYRESGHSRIFRGTDEIRIFSGRDGTVKIYQGMTQLDVEEFKKKKFLRIKSTTASGTAEFLYSESQLSAFEINSVSENSSESSTMDVLSIGRASSHIDVIDWDEFTLKRILEDFEFGVAITMVIVLYIIPRVCLFVFLVLLSLGCIQNVKIVQLFCDKIFDPYKFLTMGRRDVHTFRPGIAFRNSIIAMAVFALFMDGTIIHVFEWIVQFLAYIFASH